jgi:hypothetical protein
MNEPERETLKRPNATSPTKQMDPRQRPTDCSLACKTRELTAPWRLGAG